MNFIAARPWGGYVPLWTVVAAVRPGSASLHSPHKENACHDAYQSRGAAALLVFAFGVDRAAEPEAPYQIVKTIKIGGDGGWDYLTVDSDSGRRLYVSRVHRVEVIDADTGRAGGRGGRPAGVHGIALAPDLAAGFISNGEATAP